METLQNLSKSHRKPIESPKSQVIQSSESLEIKKKYKKNY